MSSECDELAAAVANLPPGDQDSVEAYVTQLRRVLAEGGRLAYVAFAVLGAEIAAAADPPP